MTTLNLLNIVRFISWSIVIILVVCAENSCTEARKRKRRHRGRGGKRRDQRDPVNDKIFLDALMRKSPSVATETVPDPNNPPAWTDAHLHAHMTPDASDEIKLRTTGKFGFHSPTEMVRGKVVHVADPGRSSNLGCAHSIKNEMEIPRDEPWIALIKRGRCYFFNKIKLGERYQASAVVIYDDQDGKIQVMNTIGTHTISLMVSLDFGKKLAALADSGTATYLTIEVGKTHNQKKTVSTTTPVTTQTSVLTKKTKKTTTTTTISTKESTTSGSLLVYLSDLSIPTGSQSPLRGDTGSGSRVNCNILLLFTLAIIAIVTSSFDVTEKR
uniref:E3 ubiquitin-protein ligase RING finger protein 150 (PEN-1) n=1 Tax=Phallusia mammillata TaxID=59560 RepID=A0A6F9DMW9_9ASCI|nr:E3 ubiquitin-protein ligase RING finger protein 150 (PEN-1) [Phallusia mammillata]